LAGEKIPQVPLVHLAITAAPQRWALCSVPLVWGGFTWEPLDVAIGSVTDAIQQADGIRLTLPAVTPAQLALAAQDLEGTPVKVYLADVDPDTAAVADAVQVWSGELDQTGWQDGPQAVAHFDAESKAAIALRDRVSRYTNDEQRRLFPSDTALDVDPTTDAAPLVWPAASYFKV
jgi:hypothetical protein